MAEVYKKIDGRKLTKIMAVQIDVQRELAKVARIHAVKARAILDASEHRTGDSSISTQHGLKDHTGHDPDHFVVLNDERGQWAAMTIEFGREGGNLDVNGDVVTHMKAVAPLRKAFGVAI